jgi:hypothetical protein
MLVWYMKAAPVIGVQWPEPAGKSSVKHPSRNKLQKDRRSGQVIGMG